MPFILHSGSCGH